MSGPQVRLSDADKQNILKLRATGMALKLIGERYGVTKARISQICLKEKR